jgi:hypothetical protein
MKKIETTFGTSILLLTIPFGTYLDRYRGEHQSKSSCNKFLIPLMIARLVACSAKPGAFGWTCVY